MRLKEASNYYDFIEVDPEKPLNVYDFFWEPSSDKKPFTLTNLYRAQELERRGSYFNVRRVSLILPLKYWMDPVQNQPRFWFIDSMIEAVVGCKIMFQVPIKVMKVEVSAHDSMACFTDPNTTVVDFDITSYSPFKVRIKMDRKIKFGTDVPIFKMGCILAGYWYDETNYEQRVA